MTPSDSLNVPATIAMDMPDLVLGNKAVVVSETTNRGSLWMSLKVTGSLFSSVNCCSDFLLSSPNIIDN